jgi:hypothetical protein
MSNTRAPAPILGMFVAAEANSLFRGRHAVLCAKLNHQTRTGCIFGASRRLSPQVS